MNIRVLVAVVVMFWDVDGVARAADEPKTAYAADDVPPTDDGEPRPRRVGFTLAPVAAVRFIDNLSIYSGGLAFTLGGLGPVSANLNVRATYGVTPYGLSSLGLSFVCTAERRYDNGLRIGGGGGTALFTLSRATTDEAFASVGLVALVRLGYDFAFPRGAFVAIDMEGQLQGRLVGTMAIVWGPTLQVGYRF